MAPRELRQHSEKHLNFIRSLPCCVCLNNIETEAAHIRFSDASVCKANAGVSAKPHDYWTVPLCNSHHTLQHNIGNERKFWASQGIDPIKLALRLYSVSGDQALGERVVANATTTAAAA
jgi:hypothetical protein